MGFSENTLVISVGSEHCLCVFTSTHFLPTFTHQQPRYLWLLASAVSTANMPGFNDLPTELVREVLKSVPVRWSREVRPSV